MYSDTNSLFCHQYFIIFFRDSGLKKMELDLLDLVLILMMLMVAVIVDPTPRSMRFQLV